MKFSDSNQTWNRDDIIAAIVILISCLGLLWVLKRVSAGIGSGIMSLCSTSKIEA